MKHSKQIAFMDDEARFKFVLAGRRGGKTKGMVELIAEDVHHCPPKGTVFYIGPTNQQAMELVWEDLEDRFDELGWRYKPLISKQRFEFSRRRRVQIIGAEKIRRIRGRKAFSVYGDEIAFWESDLFKAWRAIRPALSDLRGRAVLATTPNGKGSPAYKFYRHLFDDARKLGDDESPWKYFSWKTLDNPYIDQDEIEAARRELDEKSFNQEYNAEWESFEGRAYYNFEEALHVAKTSVQKIDLAHPVELNFDFNVNPTTLLISQEIGGTTFWRREFSDKNSDTVTTLKRFCAEMEQYKGQVSLNIHGDAAGNQRKSNTGYSDYHYVRELLVERGFRHSFKVSARNPAIIDRLAHANARLKNARGESRTVIDPSCTELITDLDSQTIEDGKREPDTTGNIGHKADAFGYNAWWKFLETQNRFNSAEGIV